MGEKYDFSGWATKNDLKCSDGRTIRRDAFKDNDGQIVPLVWQHLHDEPTNVLGHALLENRPEGVYAYGVFNNTESGRQAKELVEHGDVNQLSIYANKLKQTGNRDVLHGMIREVSLVLSGANPGAMIDYPILEHGDWSEDEPTEAVIYTGENLYLYHADEEEEPEEMADNEKTVKDVFDELTEEQKNVVYYMIGQALEDAGVDTGSEETVEHAEGEEMAGNEKTVKDVFDELTEEQKNVVYFMIGQALEDAGVDVGEEEMAQSAMGGYDYDMKYNVFDADFNTEEEILTHDDMKMIIDDATNYGGSLKQSFLAHADEFGITSIDMLFPEYKEMNNPPEFFQRDMDWVSVVMNGVKHVPFSRVRSTYANITEDEARAKGYIKGNLKKEEVFSLLRRTTDPQTIYKKQKLHRDDIIDITDFDVVAWLKGEMRTMLDEEIARAILIGDGRLSSDEDKISEDHIRPIATEHDLFAVKVKVGSDDAADFIKEAIKARRFYKGSGTPVLFTTEEMLSDMLLLEDGINRRLYNSEQDLATALRVSKIVPVEVMENHKIGQDTLLGIIVNLNDYQVGADKGGAINMFDDFDIDYNQMKYLMETRCSGALIKPYSALVMTTATGKTKKASPSDYDQNMQPLTGESSS